MTESRPTYEPAQREADIRAEIKHLFEAAGWEVWSFSTSGPVPKQWRGWVDQLFVKHDHVLFNEGKSAVGRLSESQEAFAERLAPHEGPHVRRVVLRHPDEAEGWLVPGEGEWEKRGVRSRE